MEVSSFIQKYHDLRALGLNSIVPRGSQRVTISQLITAEEASVLHVSRARAESHNTHDSGFRSCLAWCQKYLQSTPNHAHHLNQ